MSVKDAIVVAVDGSDGSMAAVRWAATTAARRRKSLHLVAFWQVPAMVPGAYQNTVQAALRAEVEDRLARARELVAELVPELAVTQDVQEGHPARGLVAMSEAAALVVMGARGLGLVTGALMGSVSAAVLSHAACPVVVVREDMALDGPDASGPVVVGVDGSDNSRQAAEVAYREADARGVGIRAVSSWLDSNIYASPAALQAAREHAEVLQREHQAMLERFMRGLNRRYPDIALEQVVSQGHPAEALAQAAQSAQLLVVGTHGRSGFMATVLGSTSRALLQKSPCPLMVVRPAP